jgi:Rod binding domain-containing protein
MDIQFHATALLPSDPHAQPCCHTPANAENTTFHETLTAASSESAKITDAAKQFEALIAGQVLKAAREANQGGWLGNQEDQTGELTMEMAEQSFAQALAARGDFGIAKMVTAALARKQS